MKPFEQENPMPDIQHNPDDRQKFLAQIWDNPPQKPGTRPDTPEAGMSSLKWPTRRLEGKSQ